jgi:hypothetical protein
MNSGYHRGRTGKITLVVLFLLMVMLIQFSGNAKATPASLQRVFGNLTSSPQAVNETEDIYLPLTLSFYPWVSPFGGEATIMFVESKPLYSHTVDLNIGWTRLNKTNGISWRKLQPNPGDEINWDLLADFEDQLRSLQAAGITPVISLNDSPHWAVDPNARSDGQPTSCGPIHPDYFDEYADFLQKLIKRYKTPEFNVHNWEFGNEPDVDPDLLPINSVYGCWGDISDKDYYGGKRYGEMLKYVSPKVKQVDPLAKVWVGGLLLSVPETTNPGLGKPERFLRGILESGAAPYFDVLPYHGHLLYYGKIKDSDTVLSGPWVAWGGGVVGKARYLRQIMNEYNVDKPLVQGEIGIGCRSDYSYCQPEPSEEFFQFQADMLVRVAVRTISENIKGYSWYQINGNGWRNQGLLDFENNPRPSYGTYQQLIMQLDRARYLSAVDYGSDVEAYSFHQAPNKVHVVWAKDDTSVSILVPKSKFVDAYDRDGTQITNPPVDGNNYKFTAGFSPIYIIRKP